MLGCIFRAKTKRITPTRWVCLAYRGSMHAKIDENAKKGKKRGSNWNEAKGAHEVGEPRIQSQARENRWKCGKRQKTRDLATGIEFCSTLIALIWTWKSIGLYSMDKNKAAGTNQVGVPCLQRFCGRENRWKCEKRQKIVKIFRSTRTPKYAHRIKTKRWIDLIFCTDILEIVIYRNKQKTENWKKKILTVE